MKNVFSLETERDKDLVAVAEAVAWCRYKLDMKGCKAWQCEYCSTKKEIEACLAELPACDSLKVKQAALEKYFELATLYGRPKRKARHVVKEGAKVAGTGVLYLVGSLLAGGAIIGLTLLCVFMLYRIF